MQTETSAFVPAPMETFVGFGPFSDIKNILQSRLFFPVYISGTSGNGKTTLVEQACAQTGRECIRINITIETDEDDLIGGYTLVNGNIVFREGPVLEAMRRGAVLILDECDRGSNKLMCLQPILEGKPYYIKKTKEIVSPADGFNIIATANTFGTGLDDGRYSTSQILDEAFLERFAVAYEHQFPTVSMEKKILRKHMEALGIETTPENLQFVDVLVEWAKTIRNMFAEQAVSEVISTRRLVQVLSTYHIFGHKRLKSIKLTLGRFSPENRKSFLEYYQKMTDDKEEEKNDENE